MLRKQQKSVFDLPRYSKRLSSLNILVLSDSLSDEIKTNHRDIMRLYLISRIENINIIFSESVDASINAKLSDEPDVQVGHYFCIQNICGFVCGPINIKYRKKEIMSEDNYLDKVYGSNLNAIDAILISQISSNEQFDMIILSANDLDKQESTEKLFTVLKAIEFIRLYLINQGLYYLESNYTIDEYGYYMFRLDDIFPEYRRMFQYMLHSPIEDWCTSLANRLISYCLAVDKSKVESLRSADNLTRLHCTYNFGYMVLLMTGIYDNIAWIIDQLYVLSMNKKEIGLKIKEESKFAQRLKPKEQKLCELICSSGFQKSISLLYPLRDSIVHRKFLDSVAYSNGKIDRNLILVSEELYTTSMDLNVEDIVIQKPRFHIFGKRIYVEPYEMITFSNQIFVFIVNTILSMINFEHTVLHEKTINKPKIFYVSKSLFC